jgi:hypothetical protein
MLNGTIWVAQLRSDDANSSVSKVTCHYRKPTGVQRLHIVVEKADQFPINMEDTNIVGCRIVESLAVD